MTVLLDTPIPALAPAGSPAGLTGCTLQCVDVLDCGFCDEPLPCEHADLRDGRGPVTCGRGVAHEECHSLSCSAAECWTDPDSAWDAAHEW